MHGRIAALLASVGLLAGAGVVAVAGPAEAATDVAYTTKCITSSARYRATITTTFRYTRSSVSGVPVWLVRVARGDVFQERWNGARWEAFDWANGWSILTGINNTNIQTLVENPLTSDSLIPTANDYVNESNRVWAKYSISEPTRGSCGDTHDDSQDSF